MAGEGGNVPGLKGGPVRHKRPWASRYRLVFSLPS